MTFRSKDGGKGEREEEEEEKEAEGERERKREEEEKEALLASNGWRPGLLLALCNRD